jgi:hypothetical protein
VAVFFFLQYRLQLFEHLYLELKHVVVIDAEQFLNSPGGHIANFDVLVAQLLAEQLENIHSVVEVGVSF